MPVSFDASFTRPDARVPKDAGYTGALFYLGLARPTVDEVTAYHNAGIALAFIHETGADWAFGGYQVGKDATAYADRRANDLGYPLDRPIYYAVDVDIAPGDARCESLTSTFRGISDATVRSCIGVYGSKEAIRCARLAGPKISYAWKVETWGDNSDTSYQLMQMPNTHYPLMRGYSTQYYDVDHVLADDWGQWPLQQGDDVPLNLVDLQDIHKIVEEEVGKYVNGQFKMWQEQLVAEIRKLQPTTPATPQP